MDGSIWAVHLVSDGQDASVAFFPRQHTAGTTLSGGRWRLSLEAHRRRDRLKELGRALGGSNEGLAWKLARWSAQPERERRWPAARIHGGARRHTAIWHFRWSSSTGL